MAASSSLHFFLLCLSLSVSSSVAGQIQLIVINYCNYSVWPATLGNPGHASPANGGFHLAAGEETFFYVPFGWSGRIWGRTGCNFNPQSACGAACDTGDCSDGLLHCSGSPGTPPATIIEATFGTANSPVHYYDVSLVDGFNIPAAISPVHGGEGSAGCGAASCEADVNACCPSKFEVRRRGRVVGCMSACMALQSPQYCCTGEYGTPESCKPTIYARLIKAICPRAYSFAYDDSSSLKTCKATRYLIAFCPPDPL